MVDRKPKLLAACAVLTVGVGLAMLFRRTEPPVAIPTAADTPLAAATTSPTPANLAAPMQPVNVTPAAPLEGQFSPLAPIPATNVGLTVGAGLASSDSRLLAPPPFGGQTPPTLTTSGGRPVYATVGVTDAPTSDATASLYQIHVVQRRDSLESLAERYLSDSGRSLELFDLNRDVLDNPHILPVGAELKIPVEPGQLAE